MRRHALAILAVISLIGLGVFGCGYIANFDVGFSPKTGPHYVIIGIHGGCLRAAWGYAEWAPTGNYAQIGDVKVYYLLNWGVPRARDALLDFEVEATPGTGFLIYFPLWCLILPCTIAPTLWLRRHRRRTSRGFAVEGMESRQASQPASEQPNQPPELPTDQQTSTGV